jgi:hypothetical protein
VIEKILAHLDAEHALEALCPAHRRPPLGGVLGGVWAAAWS